MYLVGMRFYTYLWLRDNGTPYYVGKGMGKRAFRKGCPPHDRIILQEWVSEVEAFEAEKFLIACYGRKDLDAGILHNRTDGGDGVSGPKTPEHKAKLASILRTILTPEIRARAGRAGGRITGPIIGRKAVESGHLARIRLLIKDRSKAGRKNVESGQLASISKIGNLAANHLRWHVKRGIVNKKCTLCQTGM